MDPTGGHLPDVRWARREFIQGLGFGADTYYMLTGHRPDRSFFVEGINRKPHADDWPFQCLHVIRWVRLAVRD